jgi:hypothetical protein
LARQDAAAKASESAVWLKQFPLKELASRGLIQNPSTADAKLHALLRFFGVASPDAFDVKYANLAVAYRHSKSFDSDSASLAAWLRIGERQALSDSLAPYSKKTFKANLSQIRALTCEPFERAVPEAQRLCAEAGVSLVLAKPLSKTPLSGAAWWPMTDNAIIQLSGRHKSDDHFWFSFFHEAAHLILHSKKAVYVDRDKQEVEACEREADDWARSQLIKQVDWHRFKATQPRSKAEVQRFAASQGVAPGIVVGMLQHDRIIPWSHMNGLKRKFCWDA